MDKPHWERSRNRFGYWLNGKRLAYIGKEMGKSKYHWYVDVIGPEGVRAAGEENSSRKAKKACEDKLKEFGEELVKEYLRLHVTHRW